MTMAGLAGESESSVSYTQSEIPGAGTDFFQCKECKEVFTCKSKLYEHVLAESLKTPYECEKCKRKFQFKNQLEEHRLCHCNPKRKIYGCEDCGKMFSKKCNLTEHAVIHTQLKMLKQEECENPAPDTTCLERPVKLEFLPDQTHLAMTVDSVDVMVEIKEEQEELNYDEYEGHKNESSLSHSQPVVPGAGTDFFQCEKCEEVFMCKTMLHEHILVHSGVTPYECEVCDERFIHRRDFLRHRLTHSDQNNMCKTCGKIFLSKSHLRDHMSVHTLKKNFKCKECGKMFGRKSNLTRHTKLHTGKKMFRCACGNSFPSKNHLAIHTKVHCDKGHFTCDKCGEQFETKSSITRHVLTH
ncbi:zinc finger protein 525-like [Portunus trituberculatus]|uniref:Zinc finger protein 160 n=1 Tax=Portunus trituberculatus TaxID=210409 RepID=A0A5B7EUE9_PORTR|nr:zinc finger protein 525-like [Portunus trituberculatus]MPC36513.1 Zinc finger protein 160 [Portunus trituberculatus]